MQWDIYSVKYYCVQLDKKYLFNMILFEELEEANLYTEPSSAEKAADYSKSS